MPRLTIDEMKKKLHDMGLKKKYSPFQEPDNDTILLKCRKPPTIINGFLQGQEIDVYDPQTIRVWSHRKNKLVDLAKTRGWRVRPLDHEAEIYIPSQFADEVLHELGAKVKFSFSPEVLMAKRELGKKLAASTKRPTATENP